MTVPFNIAPYLPSGWSVVPEEDTPTHFTIETSYPDQEHRRNVRVRAVIPKQVSGSGWAPSTCRIKAIYEYHSCKWSSDYKRRIYDKKWRRGTSNKSFKLDRLLYMMYAGLEVA